MKLKWLKMRDLVKEWTGIKSQMTNFREKNIDGIWASEDVEFHGEIFFPIWNVVGYHRVCVVKIIIQILLGNLYSKFNGLNSGYYNYLYQSAVK